MDMFENFKAMCNIQKIRDYVSNHVILCTKRSTPPYRW